MKEKKYFCPPGMLLLLMPVIFGAFLLTLTSCSKSPDTPGKVLMEYLGEKSPEKQKEYLTGDSLRMLSRLGSESGVDQPISLVTAHHSPEAEFVVLEEETRDNSSKIRLQCVEHPNENARGFTVSYILVRESGSWKVDLSGELRPMLSK